MIEIPEGNFIGEGGFQKCYIHPFDRNLCLKIEKEIHRDEPRIEREIQYYKKIQKKKIEPFWAKYHGTVSTNLGLAYVFDLVRDEVSNEVSLNLADYLKMEHCPIPYDYISLKLQALKQKMIKSRVLVKDLHGKNICCKLCRDNAIDLIVVDGIGHRDFIPVVEYFQWFTKRKVNSVYRKKQLISMEKHKKWIKLEESKTNYANKC